MTPEQAERVRAHVWPDWLDVGPAMRSCPCSVCGYCQQGRHDQCYLVRHPAEHLARYLARGVPVTWIVARNGTVTAVYDLRHPHGVWCTCHQAGHPGWVAQGELF